MHVILLPFLTTQMHYSTVSRRLTITTFRHLPGLLPSVQSVSIIPDYHVELHPFRHSHVASLQVNVSKADVDVVELPSASGITYGDDLAKSVISGGTVYFNGIDVVKVPGTFAWKDSSIKPVVADSNKTLYDVVFTPADSVNYNSVETQITISVSKAALPNMLMSVDNSYKTVGSIALPVQPYQVF